MSDSMSTEKTRKPLILGQSVGAIQRTLRNPVPPALRAAQDLRFWF
jgi:hypothetical protein